jgi:hypothetical protein
MNSTETKIRAMFVLEILGRPPEYLTETLNNLVQKIKEEKGVKVKDTKINPPALMKDQEDFYTSFAEIEVETENALYLTILMFKYMPAYIEIISPQNISLTNSELNDVLNELTRRLHGYEEIARVLQTEKTILEAKLRESLGQKIESSNDISENSEKEKPKKKKKK